MVGIYRFYAEFGRQGDLEGIFLAKSEDVAAAIGKHVRFGEVLGKHSDVGGTLTDSDIKLVTTDADAVAIFAKHNLSSGYNPLSYLRSDEEE